MFAAKWFTFNTLVYFDRDTMGGYDSALGADRKTTFLMSSCTVARSHLSYYAFVSFSAGKEVSLHVTSWKYQWWASPLTKLACVKAVCVQILWPAGCTGKQKIALSSGLTLRRMPFNQWARRSKGPIIALIDWIFLSARIMDNAWMASSCLAS